MSRGLLLLAVQLFVSVGVTALGLWALLWPKRLRGAACGGARTLQEGKPFPLPTDSYVRSMEAIDRVRAVLAERYGARAALA